MAKTPQRSPKPSDLIDPEAPASGGERVDTPAYAVPPSTPTGDGATPDDLIDVEAPPEGGAVVDTAAYAAGGKGGKKAKRAASQMEAQAPPPPPQVSSSGRDDPLDGEAGGAPPRAGPELGGGEASGDLLDRASEAALRLAADRPWPEISLRDIAAEAGVSFAELYAKAPGKSALLLRLSTRMDADALSRIDGDDQPSARDRLFEAVMSRLEVMEPHRAALIAIGRAEGWAVAPALPRTVRALLEGSGVDTGGGRGALRMAAVTAVWARVLQVWRDDEGALNRTMAEIDKQLSHADERLKRVRAGF